MGFYGFKFSNEALSLSPHFCREANGSIYFLPNGCVEWLGRKRKVWIKNGTYILRPIMNKRGTPQGLLHLLHAFTYGKPREDWRNTKIYMKCGNPLCVNPDHMGVVDKSTPLAEIYPNDIRTQDIIHFPKFRYFAIKVDFSYSKEFNSIGDMSLYLRCSHKLIADYIKTGRKYKGKWRVFREKVPVNYKDLELEAPDPDESQELYDE